MRKEKSAQPAQKKLSKKELTRLIGLLRDGDNFDRDKVIDILISNPSKEVVDGIIPLLQQSHTPTRMAVLDILKKIGSCHVEGVIGMLYDDNEDIRVYGCEVLSFLKDRRAIPDLIKKLESDADNVRNAACVALGDFDDEEAVKALLVALNDVEWIAFSAIYSIGRTKNRIAVPQLLEFFKTSGEELSIAACEVLIEYEDDMVLDEVFEILKGWEREKRDIYLKIILEKGNENVFWRLKEKIGDELDEHLLNNVRIEGQRSLEVLRMLSHFKNNDTCEALLEALAGMDPDSEDYHPVLELFGSLSDVWGLSIKDYLNRDESCLLPFIKGCKIAGIRIGEELLLKTFLNSPADVKREIMTGMPDIVEGSGLSIIREGIKDMDGHVKGFAVEAIGKMSVQELKNEIIETARKGFPDVRTKAMKALATLDAESALALMERFVTEGSNEDKKIYLAATSLIDSERNFPFIRKLSTDPDEGVRRSTITVMGNFVENGRYADLLEEILMSDDIPHEALKVAKDKRLTRFKDRLIEVFSDDRKGLWTRYYALAALGAFEDSSLFDIFVRGLKDENGLITIGCIKALGDLNDPRALLQIAPFADSVNEDIRSAAESTLEKLESR